MNIRRCLRKTLKFFLCTIHSKDVAWIFFIFILITIPGKTYLRLLASKEESLLYRSVMMCSYLPPQDRRTDPCMIENLDIVACISLCQHHQSTEFMDIQFNYTYTAGDLATLYCRIKDLGTKVVVWRRTSQPHPITVGLDIYIPDDRYHVQHIPYRGSWNLMIKNVNMNDAGVYECQISAKERAGSRRLVLLNVLEPPSTTTQKTMSPPDIYITTSSNFVEVGRTITVMCNATAIDFPTGDIDWFIDGHKVRENSRTTITKYSSFVEKVIISKLTITHAQLEDAGTYVCRTSESQITNTKIHVLSARSVNSKRGTDSEERVVKSQESSASLLLASFPGLLHLLFYFVVYYCGRT